MTRKLCFQLSDYTYLVTKFLSVIRFQRKYFVVCYLRNILFTEVRLRNLVVLLSLLEFSLIDRQNENKEKLEEFLQINTEINILFLFIYFLALSAMTINQNKNE